MSARHGGPAFPTTRDMCASLTGEPDYSVRGDDGMTLRDYFAAKAMVALVPEYFKGNGMCFSHDHLYNNVSGHAYKMADAMLAERDK